MVASQENVRALLELLHVLLLIDFRLSKRQMTVRVRRGGEEVDLDFTPRKWGGRGLLGRVFSIVSLQVSHLTETV